MIKSIQGCFWPVIDDLSLTLLVENEGRIRFDCYSPFLLSLLIRYNDVYSVRTRCHNSLTGCSISDIFFLIHLNRLLKGNLSLLILRLTQFEGNRCLAHSITDILDNMLVLARRFVSNLNLCLNGRKLLLRTRFISCWRLEELKTNARHGTGLHLDRLASFGTDNAILVAFDSSRDWFKPLCV